MGEGAARNGGGRQSERRGESAGSNFVLDASQIYRGEDILSVLALSPIYSSDSFLGWRRRSPLHQ